MKKTYSKPEILFESFTMSTNIAGDCEVRTNLPSNLTCGVWFEGVGFVFVTGMNGCGEFPVDMDKETASFNGLCYHVPDSNNNLFNS